MPHPLYFIIKHLVTIVQYAFSAIHSNVLNICKASFELFQGVKGVKKKHNKRFFVIRCFSKQMKHYKCQRYEDFICDKQ